MSRTVSEKPHEVQEYVSSVESSSYDVTVVRSFSQLPQYGLYGKYPAEPELPSSSAAAPEPSAASSSASSTGFCCCFFAGAFLVRYCARIASMSPRCLMACRICSR